jgi:molecular chaperone IbpA
MDLFDQLSRGVIGYDRLFDIHRHLASNAAKVTPSFPFYNIKKTGEGKYKLEFALSGYNIADIDITLEKNVLTVSSSGSPDEKSEYVYKGFASRKFSRAFTLMDNIKVVNAEMVNGILSIWMEQYVKDEDKPKKININAPAESSHPQLLNESSSF